MTKKKNNKINGEGIMDWFSKQKYSKNDEKLDKGLNYAKEKISEGKKKILDALGERNSLEEGIRVAENSINNYNSAKIKKILGRGMKGSGLRISGSGLFNDIKNSLVEKGKEVIKNEGNKLLDKGIDMAKNKISDYAKSKINSMTGSGMKKKRKLKNKLCNCNCNDCSNCNECSEKISGSGLFGDIGGATGGTFGMTRGGVMGAQVGSILGNTIGSKLDKVLGTGLDENNRDYRPRNGNVPQFYVKRKTQQ